MWPLLRHLKQNLFFWTNLVSILCSICLQLLLAITETWFDPGDKDTYTMSEKFVQQAMTSIIVQGLIQIVVMWECLLKNPCKLWNRIWQKSGLLIQGRTGEISKCLYQTFYCLQASAIWTEWLKENDFFDEINSLLECLVITSSKLLITGDLNFHVSKPLGTHTKKFLRILNGFNLEQDVREPIRETVTPWTCLLLVLVITLYLMSALCLV